MKLRRTGPGFYVTEDGRFDVQLVSDYETECDEAHPMMIRADDDVAERMAREARSEGCDVRTKTKRTKNGYVEYLTWRCPGGLTHFYSRWTVGFAGSGEYAPGTGPDGFDSFRDARAFAASLYEGTVR